MLLTFPWFIAVLFGSVPMIQGEPKYGPVAEGTATGGFLSCGVMFQESIQKAAKIMLATTALFLVIQLPASFEESETGSTALQASSESIWSLIGLLLCIAAFAGYLVYCFLDANEDKELTKVIQGLKLKQISIGAALRFAKATGVPDSPKEQMNKASQARLAKIIWPFFQMYDTDRDRALDVVEFKHLLHELGEQPREGVRAKFMERDRNGDGKVDFDELVSFMAIYLEDSQLQKLPDKAGIRYMPALDDGGDEEAEMPEDLTHLTPAQQRLRLMLRSCWMMGLGTALVLVFSDPMVDILSDWGRRLGISPFYISFILAPFASNASELLSAYNYAVKKSSKTMTTALSTLIGAACMNNTFCLAIFLALVYFKDLAWQFTAETLAIVLIQWVIGGMTIMSRVQTLPQGFITLLCYPGCLFVVWFFENIMGWD